MATYVNDLRLKEIATGDESGTWGTSTNTNLELIAEAFSFGTEGITTNADTHTTTIADGSTDPGRSIFLKYTGTLDSACTITIGPNTVSKLWFIENATSGSQDIIIKQGSGATVTIANGQTKAIYSDGAGSGGAMVDAFTDLAIPSLFVEGATTITTADNLTQLTLKSTDTDANVGPRMDLTRDSSSPAASDSLGQIRFMGEDAGDNSISYAHMTSFIVDPTDGSEDGKFEIDVRKAGTQRSRLLLDENETVFNNEQQDIDFRVESDGNANMLFVDAGNNHVNVGTSTDHGGLVNIETTDNGTNLLLVSTDTDANAGPILVLYRQSTSSAADGDAIGKIDILAYNDANQNITFAQIAGLISDASDGSEDGQLQINIMSSASSRSFVDFIGSTGTVFNEGSVVNLDFRVESDSSTHMLFVDAGNNAVLFGKSSLDFSASAGTEIRSDGRIFGGIASSAVMFLNRITDDGDIIELRKDGTKVGSLGINSTRFTIDAPDNPLRVVSGTSNIQINHDTHITLDTAGSERVRVNTSEMVINEDGNNYDFRVEGDSEANLFFVDASSDRIGIGTDSPTQKLDLRGAIRFGSTIADVADGGRPLIYASDGSGSHTGHALVIQARDGSGSEIDFVTGTTPTTRMSVSDSGLSVSGQSSFGTTSTNDTIVLNGQQDGTVIQFKAGGTHRFDLDCNGTGTDHLSFNNTDSAKLFTIYRGQEIVVNEDSSSTVDFRVESDNKSSMFFVDAGNDCVVIGGSTVETADQFEVLGNDSNTTVRIRNTNAGADGPLLVFDKSSASPANDDVLGELRFIGKDSGGNADQYAGLKVESGNVSAGGEDAITTYGQMVNGSYRNIFTINHVGTTFNEGSVGDLDFRVESDANTHAFFVDASGEFCNFFISTGASTGSASDVGFSAFQSGQVVIQSDDSQGSGPALFLGRIGHDDGDQIQRFGTNGTGDRGNITISGGTVSYNAFMASHVTQEVPSDTLEGTVLEGTGDLLDSSIEDYVGFVEQKRLTKCKVSDTEDSPNVYGVFQVEAKSGVQYASALGAYFVRVSSSANPSLGDLLSSKGDGTAKVQDDDIIRSKTIGKVTSLQKKTTYSDGSYLLPCVLYCG